ncbi:MAG: pentapeptide repeat-containing protein, partial [Cyanobacteriota bacterium]
MAASSFSIGNTTGLKPFEVKADQPWGQTFRVGSAGGTATVNTIAIGLYREPDAASQAITVSVRSSWNGSVLWQRTIASSQLSQAANGTYTISGITGLVLQQGQTYVLRLTSSTTDGKVFITASDGVGPYTQGALLEKEGIAQEGDLRFSISGTLGSTTSTTPTPPPPAPAPAPEPEPVPEPEPPIAEVLPNGELASNVVTSATREALQQASALNDSFIAVNLDFSGQDLSALDLADGYIRSVSFRGADLSNSKWNDVNNFIPQNLPAPEQQQPDFELNTYLANTDWNLDFRGANLFAADFTDAYLSGSDFSSLPGQITRLEKVKFDDSSLANASFRGVNAAEISFQRADLRNADFTGADLRNALFQGADLTQAVLANALLGGSNVTEAILIGTNLTNAVIGATDFGKADFTGVNLQGANLQVASLREVSFNAANLASTNLTGADLSKADFTGANLRGAILRGASLIEGIFKGADLTGADLTGADLSKADFTDAILGTGSERAILSGTQQVDTIGLVASPGAPPADATTAAGQASFAIGGDPTVGELLEADQLSPDPDGDGSFAFLWQRSADGLAWITVGTEETYEVADADAGQGLRLVVTYVDGANNSETVITAPVAVPGGEAAIGTLAGPVDPPTIPQVVLPTQAQFAIEGLNQVGEELEAVQLTSDPQGDGSPTYLWQISANNGASWTAVGEGEIYSPLPEDAGKLLRLQISYVDGAGNAETLALSPGVVSDGTEPPIEPPLPPVEPPLPPDPAVETSAVFTYDGLKAVGAEIKVAQLESDPQGDGSFDIDWQISTNGTSWASVGSGEVYAAQAADVGQQLRAVITYVDGAGNPESITLPSSQVYADPSQLVETQLEPPVDPPVEPPVEPEPPAGPVTFDPGLVGTGDVAGFTAGADLRFQLIEKVEVIGANASGIRLTGATIKDSFFYDVDFSKAILRGANLDGFNKSAPLGAPEVSLFSTFRLNFRGADLSFLQAKGTNFSGADFRNHADGTATNLRAAQLPESNLSNANFTGVTAGGINLAKAILSGALLQGAIFAGADLSETDLTGVNLSGANLQGINLSKANLTDAILTGANLTGAFLDGAILNGAILNGAILNGATLTNAQVLGSDLRNSSLVDANLSASNFTGSNFGSGASRTNIAGAITLDAVGIEVSLFDVGASLPNQFLTEIAVANVDATGMDLSGSVITAGFLYNINFSNANLSNVVLAELNGSAPSGFFTTPPTSFELSFRNANLSGLTVLAGNLSGSDFNGAILSGAVFLGTNLTDANLSGVVGSSLVLQETILLGVNFSGADFRGADFFELDLTGANFENADLRGANLAGAKLIGARFNGANLEGADLSGADLSNAQLVGANLNNISFFEGKALATDLTGATLINADVTGSDFTGSNFGSGASRTVTTGAITTEAVGIEASSLDAGADLSNQFFEGLVAIDTDLSGIDLSGSTISAAFFYNVNFSKANFSNTLFSGINASLPSGSTFTVLPTSFDLNLRGADFSRAVFEGFNFAGSDLRPAADGTPTNFSGARFIEVTFADANLSGVNLQGANLSELDLSGINLSGADLRGANLSNTKLIGADLTGAQLDGAILDGAELTNATAIGADFSGVSFVLGSALLADFEGANFSNATLNFSEFTGSYFGFGAGAANFNGASLEGAEGLPGQPLDPLFEVVPPEPVEVSATEPDPRFVAGADLSNRSFAELFVVDRNLSGINLSNSTFQMVYFAGVDFSGGNLSGAYFSELSAEPPVVLPTTGTEPVANIFTNANLTDTIFSGGNLSGSSFSGATLTRVRFLATDLSSANFAGANASGSFFREAILTGASFQNANLANADLSGVDLSGADLSGADLSGANLASAILDGANLSGAILTGATLFGATLLGAAINGALFTNAILVNADFTDATGSASFGGANLFGALGVPGAPGAEPEVGSLASDGRFSAGAQLANEVFNGIAVFGASAAGINLSGSRLLNAYLEAVDFSGSNLRGAMFAQVNAELPLGSALADLPTSFNLNFA